MLYGNACMHTHTRTHTKQVHNSKKLGETARKAEIRDSSTFSEEAATKIETQKSKQVVAKEQVKTLQAGKDALTM